VPGRPKRPTITPPAARAISRAHMEGIMTTAGRTIVTTHGTSAVTVEEVSASRRSNGTKTTTNYRQVPRRNVTTHAPPLTNPIGKMYLGSRREVGVIHNDTTGGHGPRALP
jgi:hypothetical protein